MGGRAKCAQCCREERINIGEKTMDIKDIPQIIKEFAENYSPKKIGTELKKKKKLDNISNNKELSVLLNKK